MRRRNSSAARVGASFGRAPWAWAALGALAGLLVVLVLFAPAAWMAALVGQLSSQQIVLANARGTVWEGSAQLVLTGGEDSHDAMALPGRMRWRLQTAWPGLALRIDADCCTPQPILVAVTPRWGGLRIVLADGSSQWPSAVLAGLGTPWTTVQPEGKLGLSTRGLSLDWNEGRLAVAGRAELQAAQMSSRLSTLRPMGSYRITVNGGPTATVQLDTLEGPLQLSGSGQWAGSRLRFRGTASAAPEREAALSNLLNIIGRRNGASSAISIG